MSGDGGGLDAGRALAELLRWPLTETRDPHALHALARQVLGRREHLVVVAAIFDLAEQAIIRGDLRNVRFVDLAARAGDTAAIVHGIIYDFGL